MCNKCDYYKSDNKDFNYCPMCGDKLKAEAFIPITSVKKPKITNRYRIFNVK